MTFNKDIYLVTQDGLAYDELIDKTKLAIKHGATILQYRCKSKDKKKHLREARALKKICAQGDVTFIINDHVDIALEIGADGVHLGQSDVALSSARAMLGDNAIIGITAKTVNEAKKAYGHGADYLGVGALFPTTTKTDALPMSMDTLHAIRKEVPIPLVGIGGITASNITDDICRSVEAIAVVSEIYNASHIPEAMNSLKKAYRKER